MQCEESLWIWREKVQPIYLQSGLVYPVEMCHQVEHQVEINLAKIHPTSQKLKVMKSGIKICNLSEKMQCFVWITTKKHCWILVPKSQMKNGMLNGSASGWKGMKTLLDWQKSKLRKHWLSKKKGCLFKLKNNEELPKLASMKSKQSWKHWDLSLKELLEEKTSILSL